MPEKNDFERFLDDARKTHDPKFIDALANVGDTLTGCALWFRANQVPDTFADIYTMAKLVEGEYATAPLRKPGGAA